MVVAKKYFKLKLHKYAYYDCIKNCIFNRKALKCSANDNQSDIITNDICYRCF